jgi:hypothetical protein
MGEVPKSIRVPRLSASPSTPGRAKPRAEPRSRPSSLTHTLLNTRMLAHMPVTRDPVLFSQPCCHFAIACLASVARLLARLRTSVR